MLQYREIKSRHQDAILFFRMGDFYEMFYEDAEIASRALGLTLTSRNNGGASEVPLAGVPVKAVGDYLKRLVQQGFRVSICEQTEDPKHAKGIVKREVVETVTPGATFSDDLLEESRNNYVCALKQTGDDIGIAAIDLSTGGFHLVHTTASDFAAILARFAPGEIISENGTVPDPSGSAPYGTEGPLITQRPEWHFDPSLGNEKLTRHFGVATVEAFGISEKDVLISAAGGALLSYLEEIQPSGIHHLSRPRVEHPGGFMPLDEMTRRNLELVESLRDGEIGGTLLGVLNRTTTPMGCRLLREWLLTPLTSRAAIQRRLDSVSLLHADETRRGELRNSLDGVRDIERLSGKASAGRISPRELRSLGDSLNRLGQVGGFLDQVVKAGAATAGSLLAEMASGWDDCADVSREILHTLVEHPSPAIGDEPTIASGIDVELDEWRALRDGGRDGIARIQSDERTRTGISSLKVGYNRVFGYFIEVTNSYRSMVPADYQRRQTLTGAERYVTPALKEFEERVLSAAEKVEERERALFDELKARVTAEIRRLQAVSAAIAQLDVFATLAEVAAREGYTRPEISDDYDLRIIAGRHPVVERMMQREKFIPNDVALTQGERLIILTGPNMAGKSTILRQVGLIVLMAQMGSFVPAAEARIGITDRLFTRVGASDNLVRGQSTFMVEMSETSAILHSATARSLVLLDEIGRGTSTYDGISIAWSVTEHIHERIGCKTIFATHYHELTRLEGLLDGVRNYNVEVKEVNDTVLFLHRMRRGGADRSYGIEVGRLAGLPESVLARARELLAGMESGDVAGEAQKVVWKSERSRAQLTMFPAEAHPALEELRNLDTDEMTPIEALQLLARVVTQVKHG